MSLLLYAIADCPPEQVEGVGLGSAPLRGIGEHSLVAVVSEHGAASTRPSEDQMWEYERTIESLMERWAILPARFGSRFQGEGEVREMIRARREQLGASVQAVRGAVELSVTASWNRGVDPAIEPGPANGTDYMRGRVEQHRRASALADQLAGLAELARMSTHRILPQPSLPFVGAYLVPGDRVDGFAALVGELDAQLEEAALLCTGPWPPYSFTGETTG